MPQLVLASASPARKRLLQSAGIEATVYPSDFDEASVRLSEPYELVQTLARRKAETVVARFNQDELNTPRLVLGCDSVLVINGEIHGKPENPQVAIARWQLMRGRVGELCTGHALIDLAQNQTLVRCQVTRVHFADISDRQIAAYIATGEPLNCAGCFTLEDRGGLFIEKIDGCHSNVIGLSLPLLRQMLSQLGYDVIDFWK